jgi:hypothetical protein
VRHTDDATGLVRELATVSYDTPARELSHAMDSAAAVLAALDGTDWRLLSSVHALTGRDDSVGDRAQRLMDRIGEAARAPELRRSLIPVLGEARESAHALLDAALRLERPAPADTPAGPRPGLVTDAGQVTLSEHGAPPVPSDPAHPVRGTQQPLSWDPEDSGAGAGDARPLRAARRVIAAGPAALHADLAAVREEIESFRALHPDTPVEISWRAEPDGGSR